METIGSQVVTKSLPGFGFWVWSSGFCRVGGCWRFRLWGLDPKAQNTNPPTPTASTPHAGNPEPTSFKLTLFRRRRAVQTSCGLTYRRLSNCVDIDYRFRGKAEGSIKCTGIASKLSRLSSGYVQ